MAFDFGYPQTKDAQERGWGRGWQPGDPIGTRPADLPGKVVPLVADSVSFPGGIREELHDLAVLLLEESIKRGYIPRLDDPGCWGGAFRPTKRSDGTYTTTPSNHSWYTAVDINAPHNVFGADSRQIPQAMADLWRKYGWRWLGPPIKDWMHFDFAGTPADAKEMLAKAKNDLEVDMAYEDFKAGWKAYRAGQPEPGPDGDKKFGWNAARLAAESPAPGVVGPHTHDFTGTTDPR